MGLAINFLDVQSDGALGLSVSSRLPYTAYTCNSGVLTAQAPDTLTETHATRVTHTVRIYQEDAAQSDKDAPAPNPLEGLQWSQPIKGFGWKRLCDVLGALTLLVVTSPIMLVTFLVIKLQDGGSSVYAQERVGLHGQTFRCLKFRSMVTDAEQRLKSYLENNPKAQEEWATSRKLKNDPRITRFGHFIRRSSIDELPQLFNILRGEMSLVGPRPVVPDELPRYGLHSIHYLRVRPGLTGLWQVSGRSDTSYETRVLLDREYSLQRGFWSDIGIMLRTVPAVLKSRGAI